MSWMIFLLLAGLILICLEIFIPGGIAGTLGALALLGSIWLGFTVTEFGLTWLFFCLALTLGGILISVKFVARSPLGKKLFLQTDEKSFSGADPSLKDLVGAPGKALSDLRPAGIASFHDRRVDVVTSGEYIPQGCSLKVIEVEGNRVVVKKEIKS